jgi:ubiquinone/menaquinone biosynthesis C-methylase UbiE
MNNFLNVTETPYQLASEEQLSMIITRYNFAKSYIKNEDVILEIACGCGNALYYLSEGKNIIYGCDINQDLVNIASKININFTNVSISKMDAQNLIFNNQSLDIIIFFEALYYLDDFNKFLNESLRVLKSNGTLIISSVNPKWHSFNPSPFSTKYYTHQEIIDIFLNKSDIEVRTYFSFYEKINKNNIIKYYLKKIAIKLNLIPKTMNGKKLLKRLIFGKLNPIPEVISNQMAPIFTLVEYSKIIEQEISNYKQFYITITKK